MNLMITIALFVNSYVLCLEKKLSVLYIIIQEL